MRSVVLEVFYDGLEEPSVSVPCLDFFGVPHGRPAPYFSALTSVAEGRGFNAYYPMPFRKRLRMAITNGSAAAVPCFYQIDYTLERVPADAGYLHTSFRRENPTTLQRDFVIGGGLKGPGRFLGCVVGIRVLRDDMSWYGEGEFKLYRDGDGANPTICGTGLEDYVGYRVGHGSTYGTLRRCPHPRRAANTAEWAAWPDPEFVSFYRWHLPDPIVFSDTFTATIQQIGALVVARGQESQIDVLIERYTLAGNGWARDIQGAPFSAFAIAERRDDYCAAAFIYCRVPQPVPRVDIKAATADIGLRGYEGAPRPL